MKVCYTSMPMGMKPINEQPIDFDKIYFNVIKPAVESMGLRCVRPDELKKSGFIHKSMFSAVLHSDVMIADVTGPNGNVLYELGIRHATRRRLTIIIFNIATRLPFDISNVLALPYALDAEGELKDTEAQSLRARIIEAIKHGIANDETDSPLYELFPELHVNVPKPPCVFIGHGRSKLWACLQIYLEKDLKLTTVNYESESRVGEAIVPILEDMLKQATFAVLVLTAEDETADGVKRARQNVIHEAGLFQGVLGFKRAIVLKQNGLEDFSNIAGLQYIGFEGDNIEQTFYELQKTLIREKLIDK